MWPGRLRNRRAKRCHNCRVSPGWFSSAALVQDPTPLSSEWTNFYEYSDDNRLVRVRTEQTAFGNVARRYEYDFQGRISQMIFVDKEGKESSHAEYSFEEEGELIPKPNSTRASRLSFGTNMIRTAIGLRRLPKLLVDQYGLWSVELSVTSLRFSDFRAR